MTRDGRPSRLKDLRVFPVGDGPGGRDIEAFGRRLAWWLNGEGFGIGHDPALYITLDPSLPVLRVEAKPPRFTPDDWWFREVRVGMPDDFPGSDPVGSARQGIIACLTTLRPEDADLIERAAEIVTTCGNECRFLLKVKETTKEIMEVSTTIGTWPDPSLLYVGLTDTATGTYREAPPVELSFYDDGVALASKVKVARRRVDPVSRTSRPARMVADQHGGGVSWQLADFVEAERAVMSSQLRFR